MTLLMLMGAGGGTGLYEADIEVSVAFGKGAGEAVTDADYTDITAHVRDGIRIDRGRGSELDTFMTGQMSFTLDNRTRAYDPDYAAGPYYGDLLPMRHVRCRITWGGIRRYLFKGYVRGWRQAWDVSDNDAICQVTADDGLKLLALTKMPESIYAVEVKADLPEAWYRLDDAVAAAVLPDASGNGRDAFYSQTVPNQRVAGLIDNSGDGARQVTSAVTTSGSHPIPASTDPEPQFIASGGGLAYLVGTVFSFECWFTFPQGASGSIGVAEIWGQWDSTHTQYFAFSLARQLSGSGWALRVDAHDGTTSFSAVYDVAGSDATTAAQHFAFTRSSSSWTMYHNGAAVTPGSISGSFGVASFSYGSVPYLRGSATTSITTFTIDEVALYASELSAARVLAHYTAGLNSYEGDTVDERIIRVIEAVGLLTAMDLATDASTQTVQGCDFNGATALSYLQALEELEDGRLFVAADGTLTFHSRYHDSGRTVLTAFSDAAGSGYPYVAMDPQYDDSRIVNDASVTRSGGLVQRKSDATSQGLFGTRSFSLSGLLSLNDQEMADRAAAMVFKYKDPLQRYEAITVLPRSAPDTLWATVSDIDIGERVSVRRDPLRSGSAFTKELTVEGIRHSIGVDGNWSTSYLTAPGDLSSAWFTFDEALLGFDLGRIGY